MRNYNLSILEMSESRWTGSGQRRLIIGELLLFSGHEQEDAPHTQGVAMMLSRTAQRALIGWEGYGSRNITASFRTKETRISMDVIQCYAPTNDSDERDNEEFYSRLLTLSRIAQNGMSLLQWEVLMPRLAVIIGATKRSWGSKV